MTPLYERLPRGPHRMKRDEVAENQRHRMHGAMVEAVAAQGYERTSVKQVISLAGVSRRAFYEQFANKQECFLSTLELIQARAGEQLSAAYRSGGSNIERRMGSGIRALMELVAANPKSAHMVLVDASAAGPAGWAVLTKTLLGFERTLFESFARTPGSTALPAGVVRGITGGIHMMVLERLYKQRTEELPELAGAVSGWTLAAQSPAAAYLSASSDPALAYASRSTGDGSAGERGDTPGLATGRSIEVVAGMDPQSERPRLLQSTLDAFAEEGYGNLSALAITDRAEASIDAFFNLFSDVEDCALVALARLSEELLGALSGPDPSQSWPGQVRAALCSLMHHLATHPSHALVLATGALEMGPPGIDLSLGLASEVAHALLSGAPSPPARIDRNLAAEGVAGAVWHTVYCHAVHRKTEMLPTSVEQLAYVVLAPFLGAEQAAHALLDERPSRHGASRPSDLMRRSTKRRVSQAAL